jgi:hypothetical protein
MIDQIVNSYGGETLQCRATLKRNLHQTSNAEVRALWFKRQKAIRHRNAQAWAPVHSSWFLQSGATKHWGIR